MICFNCDADFHPVLDRTTPDPHDGNLCPRCVIKFDESDQVAKRAFETFKFNYRKGRPGLNIEHVAQLAQSLAQMDPVSALSVVGDLLDRINCTDRPEPNETDEG